MKNKKVFIFSTICLATAVFLEVLACLSEKFTVFYVDRIFPVITVPLAYISGIFPFSAGEILLYIAVALLAVFIIVGVIVLIRKFRYKYRIPKWFKGYAGFIWLVVGVYSLIMVLNCFILYQYPPMRGIKAATEEETALLIKIRDRAVERANELSLVVERDSQNQVKAKSMEELYIKCSMSLRGLSRQGYPRLKGFYPQYKFFDIPEFFSQQYIMGYYFPFSMEANVNPLMYSTNFPHSICHELSHLKGYILEDEANFVAYLACMNSKDEYFEYSALLSVLGYLDRDFYEAIGRDKEIYLSHPQVSDLVISDDIFLTDEAWEKVNGKSILDTETVHEASRKFTDTILSSNGVSDGIESYSRVVGLLLDYYKNNPLF